MSWPAMRSQPPAAGALPPAGVCDVWVGRIGRIGGWHQLSDAERNTAEGLPAGPPRERFVTSRSTQRVVLGRYLLRDPRELVIERRCAHCDDPVHGRPAIGAAPLDFSVTHSGEWVVIALVTSGRVGVDVERVRPMVDLDQLARASLTASEAQAYAGMAAADRLGGFLGYWTRKEAVAKLLGVGLLRDFRTIDVAAECVSVDVAGPRIHLRDLPASTGYHAAVASTTRIETLRVWDLDDIDLCT